MDDVKRKIDWDDAVGERWEHDTGGGRGGSNPVLNVSNVLSRLDLLGTYDLTGSTLFSQAMNEQRNPPVKASVVPFSWSSPSVVTNEWAKSPLSLSTHRPAPAAFVPPTTPKRRSSLASTLNSPDLDLSDKCSDMGIAKWLKSAKSSPLWLKAKEKTVDLDSSMRSVFGVKGESPQQDDAPVSSVFVLVLLLNVCSKAFSFKVLCAKSKTQTKGKRACARTHTQTSTHTCTHTKNTKHHKQIRIHIHAHAHAHKHTYTASLYLYICTCTRYECFCTSVIQKLINIKMA